MKTECFCIVCLRLVTVMFLEVGCSCVDGWNHVADHETIPLGQLRLPLFLGTVSKVGHITLKLLICWFPKQWRLASEEILWQLPLPKEEVPCTVSLAEVNDIGQVFRRLRMAEFIVW